MRCILAQTCITNVIVRKFSLSQTEWNFQGIAKINGFSFIFWQLRTVYGAFTLNECESDCSSKHVRCCARFLRDGPFCWLVKSQLIDYFGGGERHIVFWEMVEGNLWQFYAIGSTTQRQYAPNCLSCVYTALKRKRNPQAKSMRHCANTFFSLSVRT